MHERAGTPSGNVFVLKLFALVMIIGAAFPETAPHIDHLTTAAKSNNPAPTGARRIAEP